MQALPGEAWAAACDAAVSAAGCTLMTFNRAATDRSPGEVYALRELRRLIAAGLSDRVTLALSALHASEYGEAVDAWGDPECPLSAAAITDKALALADWGGVPATLASALFEQVAGLPHGGSLTALTQLLRQVDPACD